MKTKNTKKSKATTKKTAKVKAVKTTTKTTAKTALTKKERAAKYDPSTFKPKANLKVVQRGKEFLALRKKGLSYNQIIALYADKGIPVSVPALSGAMRLAEAPDFAHEAIASGELTSSDVGSMLRASKTDEQIVKELKVLIAQRKNRKSFLKKNGFDGSKITKGRTVSIVADSLRQIRESGALKSAAQKAVLEFVEGLQEKKSVEELLSALKA